MGQLHTVFQRRRDPCTYRLHMRWNGIVYAIVITRRHVVGILYVNKNGVKLAFLCHGYSPDRAFQLCRFPHDNSLQAYKRLRRFSTVTYITYNIAGFTEYRMTSLSSYVGLFFDTPTFRETAAVTQRIHFNAAMLSGVRTIFALLL